MGMVEKMFTDGRSKKLILIAHCMLNQNAISDGTAVWPAANKELIERCLAADVGIVQLPCPELMCLGLDRGDPAGAERPVTVENTRIRRAMSDDPESAAAKRLAELAEQTMYQIREYVKHGFEIAGIIGANRSPNCGIETTSDDDVEIMGKGLFMQALSKRLEAEGIVIPMTGLKGTDDLGKKLRGLLG